MTRGLELIEGLGDVKITIENYPRRPAERRWSAAIGFDAPTYHPTLKEALLDLYKQKNIPLWEDPQYTHQNS